MPLFQLSEAEEHSTLKRLFEYIYTTSVNESGSVTHGFESTWEQVCRFLSYFDPQGRVPEGYKATRSRSQILEEIDLRSRSTLPGIEAFLDVALCVNDHRYGIGADTFHDQMAFEPELNSILVSLELLENDGTASKPLLLDAIGRWHFFDPVTKDLTTEASVFVQNVAREAWEQAPPSDREYLRVNLANGISVEAWFDTRWHLGFWLNDDQKERFSELFGIHNSLSWLIPRYIKGGWEEIG